MLLELISKSTLIEKDQVLDIANKASISYARFTIPKKRWKPEVNLPTLNGNSSSSKGCI